MAPPTVISLGFLMGSVCTLYNEQRWGLEFSGYTVVIVTVGISGFIIGGIIAVLCTNRLRGFELACTQAPATFIEIERIKTLIVCLFQLITMYLLFQEIRRITGYSDWLQAVARYRELTGRHAMENMDVVVMSMMTKNMVSLSFVAALVYAYIIGNNLAAPKRQTLLNLAPVLLHSSMILLQGARAEIIRIFLVVLITYYVTMKRSLGWKKNSRTRRMIIGMAVSVVAFGGVFSAVRELAGRSSQADPLYYVTFYAGCPMAAFDVFLKGPIEPPPVWGGRTFYNLFLTTSVFFRWPGRYNFYSEFLMSPTGQEIGNATTVLRAPYTDFGPVGMFFAVVGFGIFYTAFYCRVRKKVSAHPMDFVLLIYSYVAYSFFMYFYSCFHEYMSHTVIEMFLEAFVLRWILVDVQIVKHVELRDRRASEESEGLEKCKYFK